MYKKIVLSPELQKFIEERAREFKETDWSKDPVIVDFHKKMKAIENKYRYQYEYKTVSDFPLFGVFMIFICFFIIYNVIIQ